MELKTQNEALAYLGFWPRVGASVIDNVVMLIIFAPLAMLLTGSADSSLTTVGAILAVLVFWYYKQSTPGKMVFNGRNDCGANEPT